MLYICDFFVRHKEAVSNQIELLAQEAGGSVVAATRFMGQKSLRSAELKSGIYVFPALLYNLCLPFVVFGTRKPVHYFEEEPSAWKRALFNISKRPLYVSMYRRPTSEYAAHLKQYKYLKRVFVELDEHKEILLEQGLPDHRVAVSPTPAKLKRIRSTKAYDPTDLTMVFASWNNDEKNALYDRGVLYLLDMLAANSHLKLEIPLRDRKVDEFWREAEKRSVQDRVRLFTIGSTDELVAMFERADFVAFMAQKRVTKDVPNSLLDGLMRGKPVLISEAIDFHRTVTRHKIGYVVPTGTPAALLQPTVAEYKLLSDRAYEYAKRHTQENYLRILEHYEN